MKTLSIIFLMIITAHLFCMQNQNQKSGTVSLKKKQKKHKVKKQTQLQTNNNCAGIAESLKSIKSLSNKDFKLVLKNFESKLSAGEVISKQSDFKNEIKLILAEKKNTQEFIHYLQFQSSLIQIYSVLNTTLNSIQDAGDIPNNSKNYGTAHDIAVGFDYYGMRDADVSEFFDDAFNFFDQELSHNLEDFDYKHLNEELTGLKLLKKQLKLCNERYAYTLQTKRHTEVLQRFKQQKSIHTAKEALKTIYQLQHHIATFEISVTSIFLNNQELTLAKHSKKHWSSDLFNAIKVYQQVDFVPEIS